MVGSSTAWRLSKLVANPRVLRSSSQSPCSQVYLRPATSDGLGLSDSSTAPSAVVADDCPPEAGALYAAQQRKSCDVNPAVVTVWSSPPGSPLRRHQRPMFPGRTLTPLKHTSGSASEVPCTSLTQVFDVSADQPRAPDLSVKPGQFATTTSTRSRLLDLAVEAIDDRQPSNISSSSDELPPGEEPGSASTPGPSSWAIRRRRSDRPIPSPGRRPRWLPVTVRCGHAIRPRFVRQRNRQ